MRNHKNIFWGILFLLAACAVIAGRLGYLQGIGFWSILISVGLIAILIRGIVKRSWGTILFSLAFLCIVNDRFLGIEALTPWPVLGAALLETIGLNLLFPRRNHPFRLHHINGTNAYGWIEGDAASPIEGNYQEQAGEDGSENVRCEVSFNSTVKYLHCTALRHANLENSFGSLAVYFTDAALWQHQATANVEVSFASTELYIPSDWRVICNVSSTFGHVEENGHSSADGENVLTITGNVSFGALEIHYI